MLAMEAVELAMIIITVVLVGQVGEVQFQAKVEGQYTKHRTGPREFMEILEAMA